MRVIQIISYFLHSRKACLKINCHISKEYTVKTGIPQGSSSGPITFLIYVNSIISFLADYHITLFADDMAIIITSHNVTDLQNKINILMTKLENWMNSKKLKINISKTKYMIITNKDKIDNQINIAYQNQQIEQVNQYKYLGITIDDHLSYTTHSENLIKRLKSYNGIIYRAREKIPYEIATLSYHSLCSSIFSYAIEIWSNTPKYQFIPITKGTQKNHKNT
jgi:hypothetical protein